jgi:hypothetical protein
MKKKYHLVKHCPWWIGAALCLLTSCASVDIQKMYEGDVRPDQEIVKISVPDNLRVEAINGESTADSIYDFGTKNEELQVLPGSYDLALRYIHSWDNDPYGIDTVRSDFIMVHLDGRAGETYDIRVHATIHSFEESKRFAAQPSLEVVKTSDAAASAVIASETVKAVEPPPPPQLTGDHSNLDRLKHAWKNASKAEREAFLKSIVQ